MSEHLAQLLKELSPKRPAGRPTLLTPALLDRICRLLGEGCTLRNTAAAVGVHPDCIFTWRKENAAFYAMTENARNRARKLGLLRWDKPDEES